MFLFLFLFYMFSVWCWTWSVPMSVRISMPKMRRLMTLYWGNQKKQGILPKKVLDLSRIFQNNLLLNFLWRVGMKKFRRFLGTKKNTRNFKLKSNFAIDKSQKEVCKMRKLNWIKYCKMGKVNGTFTLLD